ncbi:exonuclease sbcCD subunit D [Paenalcaligenes hominis]|uniref:Nuclease SbcCD subunit D n=1 Tax=Paenalcaligenes hominis TaxID=643674 RepID=A0A1U9JXQ1_9BURK|nr:exonuclease SbcCD subunit D C-terminal domain-containing protein [Paenalcaligenes hominis]AQS50583.1 exonuclease sbcCD subunit D [Paenalcaligenes hominis]
MKLLHTSDWHLGRHLYGKRREAEFQAFLDWLLVTLKEQAIDVLVVAGDVFDTSTPSNQAQTQYYQFLTRVAATGCRHVVIIAGNHDSPSFINAPQQLLSSLAIHVIGQACADRHDEVLALKNAAGEVELIVCAVPYLRDRDIRTVQAGESVEDKAQKLIAGIQAHYDEVASLAVALRDALPQPVPIVATGHLFTAGGQLLKDDGVRDLYVGELGHFSAARFPSVFDYIALGHLHVPQKVAQQTHIRYCGSPIPMGFGEATHQKEVCIVEFHQAALHQVRTLPIPRFQALVQLQGDWSHIEQQLTELCRTGESVWVEVVYQDQLLMTDLRERIEAICAKSSVEVLRIQNLAMVQHTLKSNAITECLDALTPMDVFERCLASYEIPESQHLSLKSAFQEIWDQHRES